MRGYLASGHCFRLHQELAGNPRTLKLRIDCQAMNDKGAAGIVPVGLNVVWFDIAGYCDNAYDSDRRSPLPTVGRGSYRLERLPYSGSYRPTADFPAHALRDHSLTSAARLDKIIQVARRICMTSAYQPVPADSGPALHHAKSLAHQSLKARFPDQVVRQFFAWEHSERSLA